MQQNSGESETTEADKNGEADAFLESTKTEEQATQEHQVIASQVSKRLKTERPTRSFETFARFFLVYKSFISFYLVI